MPPKLPRAALRMVAMAKAKAMKERDDFEVRKAKAKSATLSVKTNKRAKDDSELKTKN